MNSSEYPSGSLRQFWQGGGGGKGEVCKVKTIFIMKERPYLAFSLSLPHRLTGHRKYIEMISDSTLQLPFKKLSVVKYQRIATVI